MDSRRRGRKRRRVNMAVTAGAVMLLFLWGAVALAAILNGDKLPAAQTSSVSGNTLSTGKTTAATTEKVTRPTTAPTLPSAVRPEGTTAPPKADNAYFDDAVFIGDSRTEGLMLYGGLSNAAFYTHKGLMVNTIFTKEAVKDGDQKITIMKALEKHKFRKVYVMLGVNELGWVYEQVFIQRYGELVDELKRLQPDAVIYIQSIMPVSQSRSQNDKVFNNERIRLYNSLIVEMCREKGVQYLNVSEAVQDENGVLPAEATTDGIHLKPAYCVKWRDYLKSHTV